MAVKFLASKRLTALSTDLVTVTPQGYAGADGASNVAGGGGGAGAAGSSKNGGNGKASSITGTSVTYAGGGAGSADGSGAGGTGGTGGGGNGGSNNQNSTGGTDGLGGGAGGGGNAGTGGSGVVILRFTTSGTTYSTSGSPNVDTSSVSGKTILKYLSSGTFVVSGGTPDVEYLVVAGGGGSMTNWGHSGGAGAGGMIEGTKSSMSNATYTVTVGAGGVGSTSAPLQGGNSVFSDVTATGGGYGGNWVSGSTNNGGDGGSGGGAQSGSYTGGSGATYSTPKLGTTNATPTFTADLSSSSGWTTNGTGMAVDTGNEEIDYTNLVISTGTNQKISYDLGSGNVSNTAWVLRYTLTPSDFSADSAVFGFISDTINPNLENNTDSIGTAINSNGGNTFFTGSYSNGDKLNYTNLNASSGGTALTNGTSYYVEIKRTSATTVVFTIRTGSHSGTTYGSYSGATVSGVIGLRYIVFGNANWGNGSATGSGTIKDVKFYNGVTSASATDNAVTVPNGSVAEETDTGKHKIWNSTTSAWVEVG